MARPRGLHLHSRTFDTIVRLRLTSRSEVAESSGIRLSFLSDLAAGRYGASHSTAKALADALEVDPAVLFPELSGFGAPDRTPASVVA